MDVALFLLSPRLCASYRLGAVQDYFKHAETEDQHTQRKNEKNTRTQLPLEAFHISILAFDLAQSDADVYLT